MSNAQHYRALARHSARTAAFWFALALIMTLISIGAFIQGQVSWGWFFIAAVVCNLFLTFVDLYDAFDNARRAEWWARLDEAQ